MVDSNTEKRKVYRYFPIFCANNTYFGKQPPSLMKYAKALFRSAESLTERKVEFWKPTFIPPAILVKKLWTNSNFSDTESSGLTM